MADPSDLSEQAAPPADGAPDAASVAGSFISLLSREQRRLLRMRESDVPDFERGYAAGYFAGLAAAWAAPSSQAARRPAAASEPPGLLSEREAVLALEWASVPYDGRRMPALLRDQGIVLVRWPQDSRCGALD